MDDLLEEGSRNFSEIGSSTVRLSFPREFFCEIARQRPEKKRIAVRIIDTQIFSPYTLLK